MRRTIGLGLTGFAFLFGLIIGAVDSRTAHIVVSTAQAKPIDGGKTGGCDGHGMPALCNSCSDEHACVKTCVGRTDCYSTGGSSPGYGFCMERGLSCVVGGTYGIGGGGIVAD